MAQLCRCFKQTETALKEDKQLEEVIPNTPAGTFGDKSFNAGNFSVPTSKSKSFANRQLNGTGAGAQEQNLAWMNYILSSMWPKFRAAGNKMGKTILTQALTDLIQEQKEQRSLEIDVTFDIELDIGENPPVFSACRTYHTGEGETEGVEVDLAMSFRPKDSWNFSCHVVGSIGPISVDCTAGVSYFEISGICSVVLTPLLEVFPVFGGGQIFFLDTPTVKMQFSGMAGLHSFAPLVMNTLRAAVVKNLQTQAVLPNSKFIAIRNIPLDTRVDLTSPVPEGVLQITVHAATGLKAADFNLLGKPTSDPVVEVQVGAAKFSTVSIKKTLNPVWDPPHIGYLFVHNPNQALNLEVYDADIIGDKDFLAYLDGKCIIDVMEYNPNEPWPKWFNLTPAPPGPNEKPLTKDEEHPKVKLGLEYLEVCDLPEDHQRDSKRKVRCSDGGQPYHKHGGPRKLDVDHVTLLRVVSVRLYGLDCAEENARQLWHAQVMASMTAGPAPWSGDRVIVEETKSLDDVSEHETVEPRSKGVASWLGKVTEGVTASLRMGKRAEHPTETRKSLKAKLWGADGGPVGAKGAGLPSVSPQVQMMIERLALHKQMPIADIAEIANMDEQTVQLLVNLRREFKVVWHQALHFQCEHPGYTLDLEVLTVDKTSLGKVQIDLQKDFLNGDTALRRRVKIGTETCPDVTFEFEVELRGLRHAEIHVPDGFRRGMTALFQQHHTERTAVQIGEEKNGRFVNKAE